jgi:hypothetical protein
MDPMPNQHFKFGFTKPTTGKKKKQLSIDYQRALPLPSATVDIIRQACQLVTGVQYTYHSMGYNFVIPAFLSLLRQGKLCQYGLSRDHILC